MRKTTKPVGISPAEIAAALKVNEKTVRRWARDGCPHQRAGNGRLTFDLAAVRTWLKAEKRTARPGRPNSTPPELEAARLRKENALADRYELMVAETRGTLIDAAQVKREFANRGNVIRNGMQTLGALLVPIALRMGMPQSGSVQFHREAQEHIDSILARLSRTNP